MAKETTNVKILTQRAFWNVPGLAMKPDHLKHSKPRWGGGLGVEWGIRKVVPILQDLVGHCKDFDFMERNRDPLQEFEQS